MGDKEAMLRRVREALGPRKAGAPVPDSGWALPQGGQNADERLALFTRHAAALKADVLRLREVAEARAWLARGGWTRVASHHDPLTDAVLAGMAPLWTDGGYDPAALEVCEVGVTCCEALVAQTGSVLVAADRCGGRGLSVLTPHHIVLATQDQLVPDLGTALQGLRERRGGKLPSSLSFITGPSRTGDIERILVLGAHGPARLTILLIAES